MKKKLAAVWDVLAAGFNLFVAFVFGGVVAASLVFILAATALWAKLGKSPRRLAGFFQIILGALLWLILKYFSSLKIKGRENIRHLKNSQPVLFISNHQGLLDPMVLVSAVPARLRPVRFLASTWIFRDKIMGKLAEATGGIQIPALVLKPEGMTEEEWKTKRRLVKMEEIIKILKKNGVV
ncbi:MAG: 1-acyl-sn-glycerol-3-phosphate acyltransferase, partial [Patescibacteria group bacterium]